MQLLIFVSILVLLVPSPINAASTFWWGDPPNRKIRQDQASEWLNCLKKVQDQIPTLSPAEKGWLETEVDKELAKGTHTRGNIGDVHKIITYFLTSCGNCSEGAGVRY
jgi:hypothetical protein